MLVLINVGRDSFIKVETCDYQVLIIAWKILQSIGQPSRHEGEICLLVDSLTIIVIPLHDLSIWPGKCKIQATGNEDVLFIAL